MRPPSLVFLLTYGLMISRGRSGNEYGDLFKNPQGLIPKAPKMYFGTCFPKSPTLDDNRAHYGGILNGGANNRFFDGQHGFFIEGKPHIRPAMENAQNRSATSSAPATSSKPAAPSPSSVRKTGSSPYASGFRYDRWNDGLVLVS